MKYAGLDYWILKDRKLTRSSVTEWGKFMASEEPKIAQTHIGEILISTVCLGIDHGFGGTGRPLLFETMIFGGEHGGFQARYETLEQAEHGHERAIQMVTGKHHPPVD